MDTSPTLCIVGAVTVCIGHSTDLATGSDPKQILVGVTVQGIHISIAELALFGKLTRRNLLGLSAGRSLLLYDYYLKSLTSSFMIKNIK